MLFSYGYCRGQQSTSSTGHFHRHGSAPVQYKVQPPDLACPVLLRKPLDATIGQLLTPYCPGGGQGDNQQNDNAKYPPFAGHFDGRGGAPVLYHTHRLMEEVYGFHKSH